MQVEIKPTQDLEKLVENLEKKVDNVNLEENTLKVNLPKKDISVLERTPGIESFKFEGEETVGLKGRPVQDKAYTRIDSRKDFAEALVATIQGYDLVVLNTSREWDLKTLRRFNPDIKHLKQDEPVDFLNVQKTLERDDDSREYVGPDLSEEKVDLVVSFASQSFESGSHD